MLHGMQQECVCLSGPCDAKLGSLRLSFSEMELTQSIRKCGSQEHCTKIVHTQVSQSIPHLHKAQAPSLEGEEGDKMGWEGEGEKGLEEEGEGACSSLGLHSYEGMGGEVRMLAYLPANRSSTMPPLLSRDDCLRLFSPLFDNGWIG